jgi:dTDP-4-dehydrorhamnose 3,5-epimerase
MIFEPTELRGVWVVEPELHHDERGFFGRLSVPEDISQCIPSWRDSYTALSYNQQALTLRGMHWQSATAPESKLVRCVRGAIFDVAVDVDPQSPTFGKWTAATLTQQNRLAMLISPLTAHGFLTLEPDTEVSYEISGMFEATAAKGFRWNDPEVSIGWPSEPTLLGTRDSEYQALREMAEGN